MLLDSNLSVGKRKKILLFRFESLWAREDDCRQILSSARHADHMDTEWVGVQKKLSSCYLMLSQWHFHKFRTLAKSIKEISEKLALLDDSDSSDKSVYQRCSL